MLARTGLSRRVPSRFKVSTRLAIGSDSASLDPELYCMPLSPFVSAERPAILAGQQERARHHDAADAE
jgi:hypothetical protein